MRKVYSNSNTSEFLLICGILLLVYFPSLSSNYLWSDDFSAYVNPEDTGMHAIRDGRPVYGLAINHLYNITQSIGEVRLIRLLSIVSISILLY